MRRERDVEHVSTTFMSNYLSHIWGANAQSHDHCISMKTNSWRRWDEGERVEEWEPIVDDRGRREPRKAP
jgi:hypothetical protein